MNIDRFLSAYVRSMRLHHALVTSISGWIGLAFYDFLFPSQTNFFRSFVILSLLFLGWGLNQIIHDYLELEEDRINARNRPMVTGMLPPWPALALTFLLILLTLAAAHRLNPLATIPVLLGLLFNILSRHAKGSFWSGNLIFSLMLAMWPIFGFLAAGPTPHPLITPDRIAVLLLVVCINAVMDCRACSKDHLDDEAADKKNFAVQYDSKRIRLFALVATTFILILAAVFIRSNMLPIKDVLFFPEFLFISGVALFLQCWTGHLYFRQPEGAINPLKLITSIQTRAAGNCALLALFNARLALFLLIASYILIEFFFTMYPDEH